MAEVVQEAEVPIEVQEVAGEDGRYRARVRGVDEWWAAETVRLAIRGAANTVTERELEAALGDAWRPDDAA